MLQEAEEGAAAEAEASEKKAEDPDAPKKKAKTKIGNKSKKKKKTKMTSKFPDGNGDGEDGYEVSAGIYIVFKIYYLLDNIFMLSLFCQLANRPSRLL